MSYRDRQYEKKIQEVSLIVSEVECVDSIQRQIDFANRHIMKSGKLRLTLEGA